MLCIFVTVIWVTRPTCVWSRQLFLLQQLPNRIACCL